MNQSKVLFNTKRIQVSEKEIRVSDVLSATTRERNVVQSEGPSVKKSYKKK